MFLIPRFCRKLVFALFLLLSTGAPASLAGAPTFQEMMDPACFPDAQHGMAVEHAALSKTSLDIRTTGAAFRIDPAGNAQLFQRIGVDREILRLRIQGVAALPSLPHHGSGFAFAAFEAPKVDLRVNGDSLFMLHAHEPVTLEIERRFDAGWAATYKSNAVVFDEWGGFGIYGSDPALATVLHPYDDAVIRYTLPADGVLWISVCPPKPYNWEQSLREQVVWHWSNQNGYPRNEDLAQWSKEGTIVLLQSEVMLWKDWNLAFEPRLGPEEFARVRDTIHAQNMRFIVYTSPYYFLTGTPIENLAMNSFDRFEQKGFPPGWADGCNIDLFQQAIEKVMRESRPDGLYFDGQYTENVPALYALARRARSVVGEKGLLEWHSTMALGNGLCFLPQADAYVDFILRGESRDSQYADPDYLRYFVSGFNTSNSIGVLCNNSGKLTPELVRAVLDANARMHTLAGWLSDPQATQVIHEYRSQLTPGLRERVLRLANERQSLIPARARARAEEYDALHHPPRWGAPAFAVSGQDLLTWQRSSSPLNQDPFGVRDGTLTVTAHASTYAFLRRELDFSPAGFVAKLRQDTDTGASWGLAVFLRWKSGAALRIGLRGDGLLQADINGEQRLFGHHDPAQWMWLRTRWGARALMVEISADGERFSPVWEYEHGGAFQGPADSLAVGKVPYNGQAIDHTDPGPEGTCWIGLIEVFKQLP